MNSQTMLQSNESAVISSLQCSMVRNIKCSFLGSVVRLCICAYDLQVFVLWLSSSSLTGLEMSDYNPDANSKLGSEMEVDAGLMPAKS